MIVYNPEKDLLAELIPLFTQEESEKLEGLGDYSISLMNNIPVAYIIVFDEKSNGVLCSAHLINENLDNGVIIEL